MESDKGNKLQSSVVNKLCDIDKTLPEINKTFAYGTAGFRYDQSVLDKVAFRTAIMTCLLSMSKNGKPHGIMITASHNKHLDNGIKVAGDKGEMIFKSEESLYEEIANAKNLYDTIQSIYEKLKITNQRSVVLFARDTRESGERLANIIEGALKAFPTCEYKYYNIVTTPCLHFLTMTSQLAFEKLHPKNKMEFPEESFYWQFLTQTYENYNSFYDKYFKKGDNINYEWNLNIDCSNGIASHFNPQIQKIFKSFSKFNISFINSDENNKEKLNEDCGAEYVQKEKKYPINQPNSSIKNLSFDGDVDRIIYYVHSPNSAIKLIDGDRLIVLYATMLNHFLSLLSQGLYSKFISEIKIGIITTAYANGALISYVQSKLDGLNLVLAKTGVKYLHEKAKNFDISVYFEANGHGTIYINETTKGKFEKMNCFVESSGDSQVLELMQYYITMFNPTTGDALSSLIATESALRTLDLKAENIIGMYEELFSKNAKVGVKNKNIIIPNENETKLLEPVTVQNIIDDLVVKMNKGRCFIRPSGTEDVVRIYVEGENENQVEEVMKKLVDILKEY